MAPWTAANVRWNRSDGRPARARSVRCTGKAARCAGRRRCRTRGKRPTVGFRPAPFLAPPQVAVRGRSSWRARRGIGATLASARRGKSCVSSRSPRAPVELERGHNPESARRCAGRAAGNLKGAANRCPIHAGVSLATRRHAVARGGTGSGNLKRGSDFTFERPSNGIPRSQASSSTRVLARLASTGRGGPRARAWFSVGRDRVGPKSAWCFWARRCTTPAGRARSQVTVRAGSRALGPEPPRRYEPALCQSVWKEPGRSTRS
jgi:hypothetical protein